MMEGEQYCFDINLDFLDSNTSEIKPSSNTLQGPGKTTHDIEALATRIASVNELAVQLKNTKEEHAKIRKQMQDLSDSAMSIRCMYEREKTEKAKNELLAKEWKEKCDNAESQLTNKTLHFEQLSSRMEQYAAKGPVSYDELVLKYYRLAHQLDEDKLLHNKEKIFLQQLQDYINSKKLSVLAAYKKKSNQKKTVHDYGVQCYLKPETKSQITQTSPVKEDNKIFCSKATQYSWYTTTRSTNTPALISPLKDVRTQGTQYISSTTTRGTCTSAFIKKQSVGTNFPEVIPVSIEQIFKEMICDVSPLSPIMSDGLDLVDPEEPRMEKVTKSIGTNTGLKNVRKPIDYVPLRIKHSDSRPPSRNMSDHIKNESPFIGLPTMNPFVGVGMNTPFPMQSTVAELWNMLGHTIFALLQSGTAPHNPLHMNMVNDRMRNLSADMSRRMNRQRSGDADSTPRDDYFENEELNSLNDYLPTTRSAATSPIPLADLNSSADYMNETPFGRTRFDDDIFMQSATSSPALISMSRIEETGTAKPQHPIEIQKIMLSSSPQDGELQFTENNSKNFSRVNEILKLFPGHTKSMEKRLEIKRLLKISNREKKLKKKSAEARAGQEARGQMVNSEEELKVLHVDHVQTTSQADLFKSSEEYVNPNDWSRCSYPRYSMMKPHDVNTNEVDGSQTYFDSNIHKVNEENFFGFDERIHDRQSDEVFCKPFLPPKRNQLPAVTSPFQLYQNGGDSLLENEVTNFKNVTWKRKKTPKSNRKRRCIRSEAQRLNKIFKNDRGELLDNSSNKNNANGMQSVTKMEDQDLLLTESKDFSTSMSTIEPAHSPNSAFCDKVTLDVNNSGMDQLTSEDDKVIDDKRLKSSIEKKSSGEQREDALEMEKEKRYTSEVINSMRSSAIETVSCNELSNEFFNKSDAASNSDIVQGANGAIFCTDSNVVNHGVITTRAEEIARPVIEDENSQHLELEGHKGFVAFSKTNQGSLGTPILCKDPGADLQHLSDVAIDHNEQVTSSDNSFISMFKNHNQSENLDTNTAFSNKRGKVQGVPSMPVFSDQVSLSPEMPKSITGDAQFKATELKQKTNEHFPLVLSDFEKNLPIEFPKSPTPPVNTSLNLSLLLKTPENNSSASEFKTPNSSNKSTFGLNKFFTISTENLVDNFLLNNTTPGADQPKFQVFLDKILDEVAPPLSPISVLAPTEIQGSEAGDSSQEENPKLQSEMSTGRKRKRKQPATAAIAVKRSARLNAGNTTETGRVNTLSLLNIPGIQLGKYTKKKTAQENNHKIQKDFEPIKYSEKVVDSEKINIIEDVRLGFFKDLLEDSDEHDETDALVIDENTENKKNFEGLTDLGAEKEEKLEEAKQRPTEINKCWSYPFKKNMPAVTDVETCETLLLIPEKDTISPSSPSFDSTDCPSSPAPMEQVPDDAGITQVCTETISESSKPTSNSLLSHIIAKYNQNHHKMLTDLRQSNTNKQLLIQLQSIIDGYLVGLCLQTDTNRAVEALLVLDASERVLSQAFISTIRTIRRPETEVTHPVPELYLSQTLRKLLSLLEPLHQRLPKLRYHLLAAVEQSLFTFAKDIIPLDVLMNLTQFYLATIADSSATTNPARLFICKCLYFYNQKAIPMIFETLCVYPSVLPKRDDTTYDRSDALINTIQCLLMSTYYDMEKTDLKTRQMFTKLCKFYNYESSKPPRDEVLDNLMAKIRAGRFKNVSYAFALICKRMEQTKAEKFVLGDRLVPLANEYYYTLSETTENDDKIACVLECISFIIKPFHLGADISTYVNLFGRFLNVSERRAIQEAALAALLRTIRFGYVHCFNAIYNFKPNYELTDTIKAMLRSFIYKKSFDFLKRLEHQAQVLVA